ncbi:MAG: hypothetical protein IPK16_19570 [Anaerolineales bacterium]|nr:hypothetical protein [Anaerolineales bacterium]
MYMNWEYRSIQLEWDDHRGEYAAAVGLHNQTIYGIDAVLNEAGGHGWELVSFTPRRDASTRHAGRPHPPRVRPPRTLRLDHRRLADL